MGPDVAMYTVNHKADRTDIAIKYQGVTKERPITIGDGCWICSRAIILPGVSIGEGCIIGAGAVVTKDMPPYSVVAGNPAKVVKSRR